MAARRKRKAVVQMDAPVPAPRREEVPVKAPAVSKPVGDAYAVQEVAGVHAGATVAPGHAGHGLSHPIFSGNAEEALSMAKRAIVLREVMGPPVGLR